MNIRNATLSDIPSIIKMAEFMHATSRFKSFNFDRDKMEVLTTNLISKDYGIFIVMDDGKILGGIMGMVAEHYFGRDKTSTDLGLFVHTDSRNAKIATLLIKEYIIQCKAKGAVDICIGNTTGRDLELVGKLYESLGFKRIGGVYCLENN